MQNYEKSPLTVRFTGELISDSGVSIYDLANTLLAIQRIVNKAHLSINGSLKKGAFPKKVDREALSLTIGERRKESDAFALVPLLTDPSTLSHLKVLIDYVVSGLVGYYVGDVIDRIRKEPDEKKQQFIGSIHADVVNIIHRIDAAGGVNSIEIGAPALGAPVVARFDEKNKDYINSLSNSYYLGKTQTIKGHVYRLYPNRGIVTIRRTGGKKVNIFLAETEFNAIRYHKSHDPLIEFIGKPRYKFGVDSLSVTDFEAVSINIKTET